VDDYDLIARNLAQGNGYRFFPDTGHTIVREPGYPMVLAAAFALLGDSVTAAQLLNCVLAALVAALTAILASRLSSATMVVLGAPLIYLFHPGTLIAISRGGFELLFELGLVTFALLLTEAIRRRAIRWFCLAGVALGGIVLVRSTLLLFPVFLLAYLLFADRRISSFVRNGASVALMTSITLAILSPWIIRNYMLVGRFVPTTSVQGISAHAGQYICKNLTFDTAFSDLDTAAAVERTEIASALGYSYKGGWYYQYFFTPEDEISFSNHLLTRVLTEYAGSPQVLAGCVAKNVFNFWFAGKNWRATANNLLLQFPFLLLAAIGAALAWRHGKQHVVAPMLLIGLYLMAVHIPVLAQARYSVPLIPFLSIFFVYAASQLLPRFWEPRFQKVGAQTKARSD
jgi:4-amino-4-deoxy-L-arabinose transferase-like glycosyltransferase